ESDINYFCGPAPNDLELVSDVRVATDRGRVLEVFTCLISDDVRAQLRSREELLLKDTSTNGVIRLSSPDPVTNCHGLTFLGGKYWLKGNAVDMVLEDNGYVAVEDPKIGDLVVYRSPSE